MKRILFLLLIFQNKSYQVNYLRQAFQNFEKKKNLSFSHQEIQRF